MINDIIMSALVYIYIVYSLYAYIVEICRDKECELEFKVCFGWFQAKYSKYQIHVATNRSSVDCRFFLNLW